jgi:hypothetical protein
MSRHELIPVGAPEAWNRALRDLPHAFQHTWEYAYAMHVSTGYPTFLFHLRDGDLRLACPLVERAVGEHVDIATPSGLSGLLAKGDWSDLAPHWDEFVRERGYVSGYIGLHPLFEPRGLTGVAPQHNSIFVLDLALGQEELMRRLDQNRRRQLRGWEARACDLVLDRHAISDFLVEAYGPFMRRVQARAPILSETALELLCHSDACIAVASRSSAGLDAAALFGVTGSTGEFLINVAAGRGRGRTVDLIWYGVSALIDKGIPLLNLGGGVTEGDSLAEAKRRYRPERLPLRSLRQVYRPAEYAGLCHDAGVSQDTADYFPAYRSPGARGVAEAAR